MTANWKHQTIWTGDNLDIMRGMNSASVDLIYLDPTFNSKANYAAPIGSKAAGAAFKDTWTLRDVDAEWVNLMEAKHPTLHRILLAASGFMSRCGSIRQHKMGGFPDWNGVESNSQKVSPAASKYTPDKISFDCLRTLRGKSR